MVRRHLITRGNRQAHELGSDRHTVWSSIPPVDGRAQWNPSGQNLTTITRDDSAWLPDRVGGDQRLLSDYATRVTRFPDSQDLALQIENELYVTDVGGSAPRRVAELAQ